jgi:endonuclease/exonuclease/phosphatase family metal-dependent hydrolase
MMIRKSLLIGALCGLILPPAMNVAATESATPESRTSINIMSYNIRLNTTADGINAWPLRTDKVAGLLRFHQADIFGVQEALPEQVKDLEKAFPGFDHYGVGRDDGVSRGEHMSVFYLKSRFEKLDAGTFWLNDATDKPGLGWDAAYNRTCTWVELKDRNTGKSFLVFNTHFDNRGSKARAESAKLILQFMEKINEENLPLILTGDFNTTPDSEPIQTILGHLKNSRSISETTPYGPEGTSGGFEVTEQDRIIDFIFVNDKMRILRHGHLSDSFGLFYPSDHLPVLAEIEIL